MRADVPSQAFDDERVIACVVEPRDRHRADDGTSLLQRFGAASSIHSCAGSFLNAHARLGPAITFR